MKKLLTFITLIFICFTGCSKKEKMDIENNNWNIVTIQSNNGEVVASSLNNESLYKELYPNMVIVDMMCEAKSGNIIITDKTNNQKYQGTYEKIEKNIDSIIYKMAYEEKEGTAIVSKTKYENNEEILTLIININGYTLNFQVE